MLRSAAGCQDTLPPLEWSFLLSGGLGSGGGSSVEGGGGGSSAGETGQQELLAPPHWLNARAWKDVGRHVVDQSSRIMRPSLFLLPHLPLLTLLPLLLHLTLLPSRPSLRAN